MFQPVSSRVSFPELEQQVLQFWREHDIERRSEEEREDKPLFVLYEGPPTANGSPGIHHVLARVFKDVIPRYKSMKGFRPLRKGGWDTHGLPVELEIERELGLRSKGEIEAYGIERFNQQCRESVFRYVKDWEALTERIGFWIDMEHPYVTLENDYIETGWWIIKKLWDQGLVYQDMKGTPHCPRCVTSLSSHEVALGYQENTPDPSIYVKFRIPDSELRAHSGSELPPGVPTFLLAWTTTPWTLPGNTALAVDPDATYAVVELEQEGERLILARSLLEKVLGSDGYQMVTELPGGLLNGFRYEVPYDPVQYGAELRQFHRGEGGLATLEHAAGFEPHVITADFVSLEEGTGIVHIAPAFGDEDLNAGREHGLAFVQPVDLQGVVTGSYPFAGKFVKEADEEIIRDLQQRGLLYRRETYYHTYPFCWRCQAPLLYYAKSSWYIRTTAMKERLISGNQEIHWYPEHIRDGRFGEWLRNNVDWAISRERYWGTPLPVWQCQGCPHQHCVGSVAELEAMAVAEHKARVREMDLHRPFVDQLSLVCPQCQGEMHRVPEVIDAWFDSGAMPFAQWHYPFENQGMLEDGRFPADYICEAVDQTRGWFYSLHALSILLRGEPCYRNVICLGLILDEQGRKMSKHLGNVVEPWEVLERHGADATRWYLFTATQPGESRRFSAGLVGEVVRRFLLTLWNTYAFFVTYATIDQFHPSRAQGIKPTSDLDRWVLSELHSLVGQVDSLLEGYSLTDAGRRIEEFVEVLSNWYVRRSRRRFWKAESDQDKLSAHATLYTCLTTLAKLLAPFCPFVSEAMYQNLVRSVDPQAPESVHLAPFPQADTSQVDEGLIRSMRLAMRVASLGRAARSQAGIKVRQPLPALLVKPREAAEAVALKQISSQVLEELNVKALEVLSDDDELCQRLLEAAGGRSEALVRLDDYSAAVEAGYIVAVDTSVTPELADEGLARELVHRIQNLRRAAGFEITDRIITFYQGDERVHQVMARFGGYIRQETLSGELRQGEPEASAYVERLKLEGAEVTLGVKKV